MENNIVNVGLINSINRQIEELQRRKEALQKGYCYIPGLVTFNNSNSYSSLADLEETESRLWN